MKILFTGGGTAGHIFPIVAIVREIRRIYPDRGQGDSGKQQKNQTSNGVCHDCGKQIRL